MVVFYFVKRPSDKSYLSYLVFSAANVSTLSARGPLICRLLPRNGRSATAPGRTS